MRQVTLRVATDADSVEVVWESEEEAAAACELLARLLREEGGDRAISELTMHAVRLGAADWPRQIRRGGI